MLPRVAWTGLPGGLQVLGMDALLKVSRNRKGRLIEGVSIYVS